MVLPEGFKPTGKSSYLKIVEGETRVRILSDAITGMEAWIDLEEGRKPIRVRTADDLDFTLRAASKPFASMVVWDYQDAQLKIWTVTQSTILGQLSELETEPEYGDAKDYDIKIKRKGKGLSDTEYFVMPMQKAPLSEEVRTAYESANINLKALYATEVEPYGGDPFKGSLATTQEKLLALAK